MPNPLELPRVRSAVVPLMRAGNAVIHKFISDRLPPLSAVIGSLNQLPKPSGGLRRVQPIRVRWRSFEVINLPARKVRAAHIPAFALAVRGQHERALARSNQNSHTAHLFLPYRTTSI